jgi:hypothetical protein
MPVSDDPRRQSADRIDIAGNPATVERTIVVDPADGATTVYEGSFPFLRDGGSFEVTIPLGTEPVAFGPPIEDGPLTDRDIESVPDHDGPLTDGVPEHLLICPLGGEESPASGTITVVAASRGEEIVLAVDSAMYPDPTDLDLALDGDADE